MLTPEVIVDFCKRVAFTFLGNDGKDFVALESFSWRSPQEAKPLVVRFVTEMVVGADGSTFQFSMDSQNRNRGYWERPEYHGAVVKANLATETFSTSCRCGYRACNGLKTMSEFLIRVDERVFIEALEESHHFSSIHLIEQFLSKSRQQGGRMEFDRKSNMDAGAQVSLGLQLVAKASEASMRHHGYTQAPPNLELISSWQLACYPIATWDQGPKRKPRSMAMFTMPEVDLNCVLETVPDVAESLRAMAEASVYLDNLDLGGRSPGGRGYVVDSANRLARLLGVASKLGVRWKGAEESIALVEAGTMTAGVKFEKSENGAILRQQFLVGGSERAKPEFFEAGRARYLSLDAEAKEMSVGVVEGDIGQALALKQPIAVPLKDFARIDSRRQLGTFEALPNLPPPEHALPIHAPLEARISILAKAPRGRGTTYAVTLMASLSYGGVPIGGAELGSKKDVFEVDGITYALTRDKAREKALSSALKHVYPNASDETGPYTLSVEVPADQTTKANLRPLLMRLEALRRSGFIVDELPSTLGNIAEAKDDDVSVETEEINQKWFNLSVGIDIDGKKHELLPIMLPLIKDGSFQLERPASEQDDDQTVLQIEPRVFRKFPTARLRSFLAPLIELIEGATVAESGKVRMRKLTTAMSKQADAIKWDRPEIIENVRRLLSGTAEPVVVPPTFVLPPEAAQIDPYQLEGAAWMTMLAQCQLGGILADEPGMGKTLQVLLHIAVEQAAGRLKGNVLIMCLPNGAVKFFKTVQHCLPTFRVQYLDKGTAEFIPARDDEALAITVCSFGVAVNAIDQLERVNFGLVVADDGGLLKSATNEKPRALRRIEADRHLTIWADVLENDVDDVYGHVDFVERGILGNKRQFGDVFGKPIRNSDPTAYGRLRSITDVLVLQRTHEEVGNELPPNEWISVKVQLSPAERDVYESLRLAQNTIVRAAVAERGVKKVGATFLSALTRMRRFTNNPKLTKLPSCMKLPSAKHAALCKLIDELSAAGDRVLVFSQWTDQLDLIAPELEARGLKYRTITGGIDKKNRYKYAEEFQNGEHNWMLMALGAGNACLDLYRANVVILVDRWWNPKKERQAVARMRRRGVIGAMRTYTLDVVDTVEESVIANQAEKLATDALLFGGAERAGKPFCSMESITQFLGTANEIFDLAKAKAVADGMDDGESVLDSEDNYDD